MPGAVRDALQPLIHPITLARRAGRLELLVPRPSGPRLFDIVVSRDAQREVERVSKQLSTSGHRIVEQGSGDVLGVIARELGLLDVVLIGDTRAGPVDEVPFAWRRVDAPVGLEAVRAAFPKVSIVVIAFAGVELVRACLHSLVRNSGWPELEIIVVDNGTRNGTRDFLRDAVRLDPRFRLIENDKNRGFAPAANQGIRLATGEFLVLLNDDTVVGPGWLCRLIAHLERDQKLGLVCPVTNQIGNAARIESSYRTLEEMEAFAALRAFDHPGEELELGSVALFCAAARRAVLDDIGLIDERYEVGMFEDDDLSRALRERGYRLAVALDAFVHHVGQASFGRLADSEYLALWQKNRRRFEQKWKTRWSPPAR